jgi:hypothetical protein
LESACRYALANEIHSYRGIKNILMKTYVSQNTTGL